MASTVSPAPFWATIINGITLVVMGSWAYFSGDSSPMALIPVGCGVAFLGMAPGVKTYNKAIAHIVVLLALGTIVSLIAPLTMMINQGKAIGIFRVGVMIFTSVVAMGFYVKSFVDARRSRSEIS